MSIIGTTVAQSIAGNQQAARTSSRDIEKKERREASQAERRAAARGDDEVEVTEVEEAEAASATDREDEDSARDEAARYDARASREVPEDGHRASIDVEA